MRLDRIRCRAFALAIVALSSCSGGGGGGSSAPEAVDSAPTAQAQDIVIIPSETVLQTPPADASPSPLRTQSTQSTTPQTHVTITDLNINQRTQSGRSANFTMTTAPENGSWQNISFNIAPYDAGRMCCGSVYQPFFFFTFNCLRRYHGEVDITFIVAQASGPIVRKRVKFTCT